MDPSNVKTNRQSVFVQLLTIGISDSKIHTSRNTYPIVIGPANATIDQKRAVLDFIVQDMHVLASGIPCYHGEWKQKIQRCRGIVYSVLADRPAKASALSLFVLTVLLGD